MSPLVIHPTNQQSLTQLRQNLPQSLLLSGERGVGLYTIALSLADQPAAIIQPVDAKGQIDSENGLISVESIRQLYDQTKSKQSKSQVIIIDDADRMSNGAQGAFLKLLEEPGQHTHFILTSHAPQRLLSTIRSRVQHHVLQPATRQQSVEHIQNLSITDQTKHIQLLFIAEGLPAELTRLINDDAYFAARAKMMGDARQLLQASPYEKLLVVNSYQSDRPAALQLIDSALIMLRRTVSAKPQPILVKQLDLLLDIRENITSNYSVRLQLSRVVL